MAGLARAGPLAQFLQRYETVQGQVETIEGKPDGHRLKMSRSTNERLETNAQTRNGANAGVRQIMEQGVFSIDSIERANQCLIDAIEDSLRITQEGRQKPAEAEQRLVACEGALKQAMRQSAT